ncbi:MAG: hypothetical protein ABFD66_10770 [Smithella sp.]
MDQSIERLVVTALISCVFSIIIAVITTNHKLKKQFDIDKEKENERIRIKYLQPLLVAAQDLLERITDIRRRRMNNLEKIRMMQWFNKVKTESKADKSSFAFWANDEGYFAVSTLYITAVYFSYASKLRREFPFIQLSSGDNKDLLYRIADVRFSIGGKFGIWEAIQDSLGRYLINEDGSIKNYRNFTEAISSEDAVWFNRLIDFYQDIDKKLEDHLENIESSLEFLIEFLSDNLQVKRTEYWITDESLAELADKNVPPHVVEGLKKIKGIVYKNEFDFFHTLVLCIGQDDSDDYKPSIMRHAAKKDIELLLKN